jgi:hypothetical protein
MSVKTFFVPVTVRQSGHVVVTAEDEDQAMLLAYQFMLLGDANSEFEGEDRSIEVALPIPEEEEIEQ